MSFGRPYGRMAAVAAAGLVAASAGSAVAQQTPTTTPIPNQVQPGSTPEPSTTIAPRPPQNYTRYDKVTFAGQGVKPKSVTAAVQMTKDDLSPARGYTAPTSMVPDPENPRVIVAAVANLRDRTCHLIRSADTGRTWHLTKTPPSPPGFPLCTSTMSGVPEPSVGMGTQPHPLLRVDGLRHRQRQGGAP